MAGICFFRRFVTVLSKDFECSFWCHLGQVTGRPTSPRPHGCPGPFPLSTPWCLPNAPDWASKKPCFFNQTYHGYDKYISIVDIKLYIYIILYLSFTFTPFQFTNPIQTLQQNLTNATKKTYIKLTKTYTTPQLHRVTTELPRLPSDIGRDHLQGRENRAGFSVFILFIPFFGTVFVDANGNEIKTYIGFTQFICRMGWKLKWLRSKLHCFNKFQLEL